MSISPGKGSASHRETELGQQNSFELRSEREFGALKREPSPGNRSSMSTLKTGENPTKLHITEPSESDIRLTCPKSESKRDGVENPDYKSVPSLTCPNYRLQDSNVKYYLPEKDVMPSGDYCSGYLSAWPAHMTGKIVRSIRKPKSSGTPKYHGYDDEFASNSVKPQFLVQLEEHLRKELQTLDLNKPNMQEVKLQAYREVFEYFIEDLKTYKPLLAAIKNEYEKTLAYKQDKIRELEPLKAMMFTTVEQYNQKIMAIYEQESVELKTLKIEKLDLLKQIDKSMEMRNSLKEQVAKLLMELQVQYKQYRDEYDARRLLLSDFNNLRVKEESKPSELRADITEDTIKLNLALKVTRQDLTSLQVELNTMKAEYGDVIPRREFEMLEKNYTEFHEKHEHLQKDYNMIKLEHSTLIEVHKHLVAQRDKLLVENEHLKSNVSGAIVPSESQEVSQVTSEVEKKAADDFVEFDEFEGLGTGDDVLVYLRHDGLVKNTHMSKKDIVSLVKEIWKEKIQADRESGIRSSFPEFFLSFLQKKYGDLSIQWAYNIYYGCRHCREDNYIDIFFRILNGTADESMYHGQAYLISNLEKQFSNSNSVGDGFISKLSFSHLLKRTFPNKTNEYLDELLQAAEIQGGADEKMNFKILFSENEEDRPGPFIILLIMQKESEKIQYLEELKSKLEYAVDITTADLKNAFQAIDPSISPQILDMYIAYAFQTTKEQIDQAGPLDLDVLVDRLQICDVKRIGSQSIE